MNRWQITLEQLRELDTTAPLGGNRSVWAAKQLGCPFGAVEKAKKKYSFKWTKRPTSTLSNRNTNVHVRKYVKDIGCVVCRETRVVDAAHVVAVADGGCNRVYNIAPLCPTHHRCYDHNRFLADEATIFNRFIVDALPQLKAAIETYETIVGKLESAQYGIAAEEARVAKKFWDESKLLVHLSASTAG